MCKCTFLLSNFQVNSTFAGHAISMSKGLQEKMRKSSYTCNYTIGCSSIKLAIIVAHRNITTSIVVVIMQQCKETFGKLICCSSGCPVETFQLGRSAWKGKNIRILLKFACQVRMEWQSPTKCRQRLHLCFTNHSDINQSEFMTNRAALIAGRSSPM